MSKLNKLKHIGELLWDLLIIDEAHEGVDTYKTDTAGVSDENIRQAKEAWEISDMIIRYDYLGHKLNIKEEPVKVAGVK